jgi:hypothetical protein
MLLAQTRQLGGKPKPWILSTVWFVIRDSGFEFMLADEAQQAPADVISARFLLAAVTRQIDGHAQQAILELKQKPLIRIDWAIKEKGNTMG